jgi:hypothetical protein
MVVLSVGTAFWHFLVGKLVVFVGLFLMGNIILGYVRVGFIAMC